MITLVLGGARSGKSAVAERMAGALHPPVTYLATMVVGDDPDLAARVQAHRERRPAEWRTVDAGADLPGLVARTPGPILIDSLGPWVAAHAGAPIDATALTDALRRRDGDAIVVSEEVGLGVHPSSEAGRLFRDALGQLNQAVAALADQVFWVVAGRTLRLD
ncbi:MAG TPA: bifunctional adenosylcobinamide kinase/adenosylcobinamide-phosphate guanylyltransferase [Acidimicrobiales bacterium]|jgi:adenosyl cobinamide kinase/adenosyl cobinamide phosphate guanylyltransferase